MIGANGDDDGFPNVIGIGTALLPGTSNVVSIGSSSQRVLFAGPVDGATITNTTITGTNQWRGDIATPPLTITSAGAGNNTINATNRIIRVTGTPGAAWTVAAITSGRDGREFRIYNDTGYAVTVANESAFNGDATTRIRTMSGADYVSGTNAVLRFFYDGTRSRWILESANP